MWSYTFITLVLEAIAVTAQQAIPTNGTLPPGSSELFFQLSEGPSSFGILYGIDYALDANRGSWNNAHPSMQSNQTVFVTSPFNVSALTNNSIAYISCDPSDYAQSNLNLTVTIQQATSKIAPSSNQDGAIILYSATSNWCNYTADTNYSYPNVFILPGATRANALKQAILQANPGDQIASIFSRDTTLVNGTTTAGGDGNGNGNGDNGSNGGPMTPSTTVAMIILYSVTGIITLCFVVVIITGALRARRHPERYGLLNLPGNAHQRRARGLARAMLDTIPIVKFGEKEPLKLARDVETGTELHPMEAHPVEGHNLDGSHSSVADSQAPAENAAASETAPQETAEASAAVEDDTDNGLACSVCTEDFVKGEDLRLLPCDHKFHPECIDPWLLNISGTCPLCRIDLRPPEQREETAPEVGNENSSTPPSTNPVEPAATAGTDTPPNRTNRLSMFLNRRRMGEATPAQRLRILRELRNVRRNNAAPPPVPSVPQTNDTSASATPADSTPPRSNRVTRLFGRREGSPPTSSPERANPQQ